MASAIRVFRTWLKWPPALCVLFSVCLFAVAHTFSIGYVIFAFLVDVLIGCGYSIWLGELMEFVILTAAIDVRDLVVNATVLEVMGLPPLQAAALMFILVVKVRAHTPYRLWRVAFRPVGDDWRLPAWRPIHLYQAQLRYRRGCSLGPQPCLLRNGSAVVVRAPAGRVGPKRLVCAAGSRVRDIGTPAAVQQQVSDATTSRPVMMSSPGRSGAAYRVVAACRTGPTRQRVPSSSRRHAPVPCPRPRAWPTAFPARRDCGLRSSMLSG